MWSFFRRQTFYFIWGFAISLVAIVAWKVGVSDLINYAAVSAIVGVAVSAAIFFLERKFPDRAPTEKTD